MNDEIMGQASRNIELSARVAMQLGQYLARIRQQKLVEAERESAARAAQMRQVMNAEKELARPVLERACTQAFWDVATPDDAAQAYGLAKRFEHADPQAAITARKVENEVLQRWQVDLTAAPTPEAQGAIDQMVVANAQVSTDVPPPPPQWQEVVADEQGVSPTNLARLEDIAPQIPGDPFTKEQWGALLADAHSDVSIQHSSATRLQDIADDTRIEARDVQAETPGETTPEIEYLEHRAEQLQGDADGEWDTLDARQDYAASVKGRAPDGAIRARVTADKGFTKPGRRSVEKTRAQTPVKRVNAAQQAVRKQTL